MKGFNAALLVIRRCWEGLGMVTMQDSRAESAARGVCLMLLWVAEAQLTGKSPSRRSVVAFCGATGMDRIAATRLRMQMGHLGITTRSPWRLTAVGKRVLLWVVRDCLWKMETQDGQTQDTRPESRVVLSLGSPSLVSQPEDAA
jgi:hypothetical protein